MKKLNPKNLIPMIRDGVFEKLKEDEIVKVAHDRKFKMIQKVIAEYERASKLHKPFNSPHEGYAVIKEEVDEMWDCIKENEVDHARREAMQVGAMALRFLIDIKPDPKSP